MTTMTYAEAHAKLAKELRAAHRDGQDYVVLPLPVAERLEELCAQVAREEAAWDEAERRL